MWQLLIAFYFVFGATSYMLRRELAQKLPGDNRVINAIFFLFFLFPAGIVLSLFFPHDLSVGWLNFFFLVVGSIIWPLFYIAAFNANKKVDAGIFAIINNVSPVATLAIALPFLNESVNTPQVLGIVLLIFSGIVAASSQLRGHARASTNGILLCVVSAVVLGIAVAYERWMLGRVDFGAYLIYGWGSQIAWSVFLAREGLRQMPALLGRTSELRGTIITWGTSSVLRSITFILALKLSGSASLVSGASDFMSVAVVIAAYFYLKEREHVLYKSLAAIVGVVGLLFIAG